MCSGGILGDRHYTALLGCGFADPYMLYIATVFAPWNGRSTGSSGRAGLARTGKIVCVSAKPNKMPSPETAFHGKRTTPGLRRVFARNRDIVLKQRR